MPNQIYIRRLILSVPLIGTAIAEMFRITEDGNARITENGNTRITE